jgi:hypothetical protein
MREVRVGRASYWVDRYQTGSDTYRIESGTYEAPAYIWAKAMGGQCIYGPAHYGEHPVRSSHTVLMRLSKQTVRYTCMSYLSGCGGYTAALIHTDQSRGLKVRAGFSRLTDVGF